MDEYICRHCKKELIKARNTKKYCNATCRKEYHRHISVADKNVSVTVEEMRTAQKLLNQADISVARQRDSVAEEELTYSSDY